MENYFVLLFLLSFTLGCISCAFIGRPRIYSSLVIISVILLTAGFYFSPDNEYKYMESKTGCTFIQRDNKIVYMECAGGVVKIFKFEKS